LTVAAAIEQVFSDRFANWDIRLPEEVVEERLPGHIFKAGWHIGFVWGDAEGEEYLELLSQHRMTSDQHVRLFASGRLEELPAQDSLMMTPAGADEAEVARLTREHFAHNQGISDQLRERGLLPPAGANLPLLEANDYLRSGGGSSLEATELGHVYVDPTGPRRRPSLVGGLMDFPTKARLSPVENQLTATLAWLLDRSERFARAFLALYAVGDPELGGAIEKAETVGARGWVTLPQLPGYGVMYPDLSIVGNARTFELLVEVKVDAAFHEFVIDGASVLQPDAYLHAWLDRTAPKSEAKVRRIGTLTRAGDATLEHQREERAPDVSWGSVRAALAGLLADGGLDDGVALVAEDFLAVIDARALQHEVVADQAFLGEGGALVAAVVELVCRERPQVTKGPTVAPQRDYAVGHLRVKHAGSVLAPWLFVTVAGGRYNAPGAPDSIWLAERADLPFPPWLRNELAQLGVPFVRDNAGFSSYRRSLTLADVIASGNPAEQARHVSAWVDKLLDGLAMIEPRVPSGATATGRAAHE